MNKWMVFPALAGILTIGGVAAATGGTTQDQAEPALLDAHQHEEPAATELPSAPEREQGRVVYDIQLQEDAIQEGLEPDGQAGDGLKAEAAAVLATENSVQPTKDASPAGHTLTVVSSPEEKPARPLLTKKEAVEIAKRYAVGTVDDIDIEKEKEDGKIFYEIELEDELFEYEILMDAVTGDILSFEQD